MDIHKQWEALIDRNPPSGEIISFCVSLVREYWRIAEEPRDQQALNKFYNTVLRGNRAHLVSVCLEFVLEQTEIQLKYPEWCLGT